MNNCDRCEGKGTIQVSKNGIIVVCPCPKCNELKEDQENGLEVFENIRKEEK